MEAGERKFMHRFIAVAIFSAFKSYMTDSYSRLSFWASSVQWPVLDYSAYLLIAGVCYYDQYAIAL